MAGDDESWIGAGFKLVPYLQADWSIAFKRSMAVVLENIGSDERRTFLEDLRGGPVCPVAWGPDGRTLFTSRNDEIVAIDSVDGSVRTVGFARVVWHIEASPEGDTLVFLQDTGALRTLHLATGSIETLMDGVWSSMAIDWTDRAAYAVRSIPPSTSEVWRVGLDASAPIQAATLESCGRLSLSHDRRLLALGEWVTPSRIRTVDVQTGEVRTVGRGNDPSWCPLRRDLAFRDGDAEVFLWSETGDVSLLLAAPGQRDTERRDGGWGGRPSWSPDGQFVAVAACRATFDHEAFARADPSNEHRHSQSWRYELKRAVFDLERREVIVRDGNWSDVAWRPRADA